MGLWTSQKSCKSTNFKNTPETVHHLKTTFKTLRLAMLCTHLNLTFHLEWKTCKFGRSAQHVPSTVLHVLKYFKVTMEPFHHSHIPLCTYWSSVGSPSPTAGTSYPWWICTCRRGSLQSLAAEGCVGLQSVGHYEITKTISFHILIKQTPVSQLPTESSSWAHLYIYILCAALMHVEMSYLRAQTCLHLRVHLVASLNQLFCQLHVISRKAIMCPQRKCARQETNQVVLKGTGKEEKRGYMSYLIPLGLRACFSLRTSIPFWDWSVHGTALLQM